MKRSGGFAQLLPTKTWAKGASSVPLSFRPLKRCRASVDIDVATSEMPRYPDSPGSPRVRFVKDRRMGSKPRSSCNGGVGHPGFLRDGKPPISLGFPSRRLPGERGVPFLCSNVDSLRNFALKHLVTSHFCREETMENLEGKTAFVTGASQGIGRACALALAKMGARVALAARNEAKLEAVAAEITAGRRSGQVFPHGRVRRSLDPSHSQGRHRSLRQRGHPGEQCRASPGIICCCA